MSRRVYSNGVLLEEWDDANLIYRRFVNGEIVEERPYTVAEVVAVPVGTTSLETRFVALQTAVEAAIDAATTGAVTLAPLRAALARSRLKPARIVFYGSSTTAGSLASETALSYVNIFARRIQSAYPSGIEGYEYPVKSNGALAFDTAQGPLPGVQVLNSAAIGYSSADYISNDSVVYVGNTQPDCFMHMIGSNDYYLGVNPTVYRSQIEGRMNALEAKMTHPTCHVLIHSYRRLDVTTPAFPWTAYRDALKAIADSRDNVMLLDFSDEYDDLDYDGADTYGLMSPDLIHQTDNGHAHAADLLYRSLTPAPSSPLARVVLSDTFTRPAGALGSTEQPTAAYSVLSGTWGVIVGTPTNGAAPSVGGTVVVEAGVADLDITAVITPGTGTIPGIIFRAQDDSNRLGFFINPGSSLAQIFRVDLGTNTAVATAAYTFTRTHYVMRVIARGDTITCFINGGLVLTYTLSGADQTKFGVFTKVGFRSAATHASLKFWGLSVRRPL